VAGLLPAGTIETKRKKKRTRKNEKILVGWRGGGKVDWESVPHELAAKLFGGETAAGANE
jgi:hypothetical protein